MSGRILLIGGTGFLGSAVAARLAGRDVVALVRASSNRALLPPGMAVREGDLDGAVPLEGVETLVYCASMGFGQVPRLLQQLEHSTVRRGVFLSTTAIFTSLPAASKATRLEAEAAVRRSRLAWTILRPTMIYGTARDRNISRLLRWLHRWGTLPVCGDGLWQPIYVHDLAAAVIAALDAPVTVGRAYNLAGQAPLRFRELVRLAAQAVGRPGARLVPVPLPLALLAARLTGIVRPEQIMRLIEDKAFEYGEAAHDFGFAPRSFADGVTQEACELGLRPA